MKLSTRLIFKDEFQYYSPQSVDSLRSKMQNFFNTSQERGYGLT